MRCFHPVHLQDRTVPCGRCIPCLSRRQSDWTIRLTTEYMHSTSCYFVTLTYRDGDLPYRYTSLPYDPLSGDFKPSPVGHPVLFKRHIQLYLKRLRKAISPAKIRFFCCGEYGPKTLRPHYHMLVFNLPTDVKSVRLLHSCWKHGFTTISKVSPARIAYVAKYSSCYTFLPEIYRQKQTRPFVLCSNGIGSQYLTSATIDYHRDTLSTVIIQNGYKKALPKYYRDRIFDDQMKYDIRVRNEAFLEEETRKLIDLPHGYYDTLKENVVNRTNKLIKTRSL